jgi:hypothetical protein
VSEPLVQHLLLMRPDPCCSRARRVQCSQCGKRGWYCGAALSLPGAEVRCRGCLPGEVGLVIQRVTPPGEPNG